MNSNENRVKHSRRKVTQEQVDAMNRELKVRNEQSYQYIVDVDGRLSTQKVYIHYCW